MDLGSRIRAARRAAGLSQEQLARRADMSLKGMGDIERGVVPDPHYSSLSKIASGLGISIGELLEEPSSPKASAPTSSTNPPSGSAAIEAGQQSVEAASPSAEEVDTRIKEAMANPRFSVAGDIIERLHFGSDAVESFIEHRVKAYEEELEDSNSPHFRTATAAALWAETLQREANMLAGLGLEEVRPYLKNTRHRSSAERGWAAVETLKHIARRGSAFKDLLRRADERIAAMHDPPDVLAQKRLEQAQKEAEESKCQVEELRQQLLA